MRGESGPHEEEEFSQEEGRGDSGDEEEGHKEEEGDSADERLKELERAMDGLFEEIMSPGAHVNELGADLTLPSRPWRSSAAAGEGGVSYSDLLQQRGEIGSEEGDSSLVRHDQHLTETQNEALTEDMPSSEHSDDVVVDFLSSALAAMMKMFYVQFVLCAYLYVPLALFPGLLDVSLMFTSSPFETARPPLDWQEFVEDFPLSKMSDEFALKMFMLDDWNADSDCIKTFVHSNVPLVTDNATSSNTTETAAGRLSNTACEVSTFLSTTNTEHNSSLLVFREVDSRNLGEAEVKGKHIHVANIASMWGMREPTSSSTRDGLDENHTDTIPVAVSDDFISVPHNSNGSSDTIKIRISVKTKADIEQDHHPNKNLGVENLLPTTPALQRVGITSLTTKLREKLGFVKRKLSLAFSVIKVTLSRNIFRKRTDTYG